MRKITSFVVLFILALWLNPGFALQAETGQEQAEPATGETAEAEQAEAEPAGAEQADEEEPPPIMDQPLDGTSIETFTAGLEKLDAEVSEEQYRQVMSALDFLLFYDIGARRSKAKLYARLDGKTPNQILKRVATSRGGKR